MEKNLWYQVTLFLGLLLFSLSLIHPRPVIVLASFCFSLIALVIYRKTYPRVDRNLKQRKK